MAANENIASLQLLITFMNVSNQYTLHCKTEHKKRIPLPKLFQCFLDEYCQIKLILIKN